jgi:hypothetical protein
MRAFLDTSILTIYCLSAAKEREQIVSALKNYSEVILFRYAIKEFECGPLRAFVLVHQCLLGQRGFEQVLHWIERLLGTPRRNLPATALFAIRSAYARAAVELRNTYFTDSNFRNVMRLHLKRQVLTGWDARLQIANRIIPDLPCYPETGPTMDRKNLRLPQPRCYPSTPCALVSGNGYDRRDIQKLLLAIDSMPANRQVDRWRGTLSKILKGPISHRDCRGVGDAFFCLFAPLDSTVVTTNIRDHRPLAASLGKTASNI